MAENGKWRVFGNKAAFKFKVLSQLGVVLPRKNNSLGRKKILKPKLAE